MSKKVKNTEYYDILGVSPNSTLKQIQKAYKKKALKWHPDKNTGKKAEKAEEMFKKLGEAYEILSNNGKREIYDLYGKDGINDGYSDNNGFHTTGHSFTNPQEIFNRFFGGKDPFQTLFMNDPFFKNNTPSHNNNFSQMFNNSFGNNSPFNNNFFNNTNSTSTSTSFSSYSSSSSSTTTDRNGITKTISTSNESLPDGRRLIKKKTVKTYKNGRVETHSEEYIEDNNKLKDDTKNLNNNKKIKN
jgi:curved DNA-binding protein CbpA